MIDRDWRTYLDRKVVHFAYFYLLWCTIQFAFKAPGMAAETARSASSGSMRWPLSSRSARCGSSTCCRSSLWSRSSTRNVSPIVFPVAAALEIAPIATGWTVIDEFAGRFVYFFAGYSRDAHLCVRPRAGAAAAAPACWPLGVINGVFVFGGRRLPVVCLRSARRRRRGGRGRRR